jgi:hypothetical protein
MRLPCYITFCDDTEIFSLLSFILFTSLTPVRNIFLFFRYPLSPALYVPNSKSLKCYDKSELSNQSSEDELPLLLQISLHPLQPRFLLKPASPTHITYCTGGDNATRKGQTDRQTYCHRILKFNFF